MYSRGGAPGRRGAGRGRHPRRHPAQARDPAQLPGRRAPALPARAVRAGAAAVHRHLQRRGAAVQPRPAPLGLRLGQAGEQLLRLRHRQRHRERRGLAGHQAPHLRRPRRADGAARRRGRRRAGGQGAGRAARTSPRVPAGVGRQHLGDELRLAVAPTRSRRSTGAPRWPAAGTTPARAALSPYHRNGGDLVFQIGTAYFGCRDETGRLRPRPARPTWWRRRRCGHRDQALAGRQAGSRRDAAGRQGQPGDRRDPRHRRRVRTAPRRAGTRSSTTSTRCSTSSSGSPTRRGCRWASSPRSATWSSGTTWSPRWRRTRPRRRLRQHRRRRGRHRRRAAGLRRLGRLPLPARLRRGLPPVRRAPGSPTRSPSSAPASSGSPRPPSSPSPSAPTRSTSGARRCSPSAASRPRSATPTTARPASPPRTPWLQRGLDPHLKCGAGRQLRRVAAPGPAQGLRGCRCRPPRR